MIIPSMRHSAWMLSSKDAARAGSACFLPSTPAAACSDTYKRMWWEGNGHLTIPARCLLVLTWYMKLPGMHRV